MLFLEAMANLGKAHHQVAKRLLTLVQERFIMPSGIVRAISKPVLLMMETLMMMKNQWIGGPNTTLLLMP